MMGVLLGSLLFLLLPGSAAYRLEQGKRGPAFDGVLEERRGRLTELAESFKSLARSIGRFHTQNDLSFAAAVQLTETAALLEDMTQQMGEYQNRGKQEAAIERALERARIEVRYVHIIKQQNGRERIQAELRGRPDRYGAGGLLLYQQGVRKKASRSGWQSDHQRGLCAVQLC